VIIVPQQGVTVSGVKSRGTRGAAGQIIISRVKRDRQCDMTGRASSSRSRTTLFLNRAMLRSCDIATQVAHRAGFKCVEAVGRIIIRGQSAWWGAGVVVCLEQSAENSMIYI